MQMKFSANGIPYILFDENNKLIFSKITKSEKGYKYLTFVGGSVLTVNLSGSRAKRKKIVKTFDPIAFTVDMNFKRDGKKGLPIKAKKVFDKITLSWLQKKIQGYLIDGGYFPDKNILKLKNDINGLSDNNDENIDHFELDLDDNFEYTI